MAFKQFALDEQTTVTIYKRRGSRHLRLSVTAPGQVRVSMPTWLSYAAGLQFARSRQSWIADQRVAPQLLRDGQAIGKAHHLRLVAKAGDGQPTSRVSQRTITISYPTASQQTDSVVQAIARKACLRALRSQAEALLPQRLASLAAHHGFHYRSVAVKQLKSRWGSCDHQQNIVLNLFLMQLPWELIDYVLLHELVHTEVLRHGPDFWKAFTRVLPTAKTQRRAMRQHRPQLQGPVQA